MHYRGYVFNPPSQQDNRLTSWSMAPKQSSLPTSCGIHQQWSNMTKAYLKTADELISMDSKKLAVGVLDRQTYQGGTRGSRLCGGDRDRETENSKVCARTRDTRFIQVRAAKVASPTSCLGDQVWRPALVLVEIRCPARYPALLYIVQGEGS
jgi:hypothetical protein